jgi:hypothetical protein
VGETLGKNGSAMSEPFFGENEFLLKLLEVGNTKVFEFAPFEQIPYTFLGIEPIGVPWQAFQMKTLSSTPAQKILDDQAAMKRGRVPNDQQFPRNFASEHL